MASEFAFSWALETSPDTGFTSKQKNFEMFDWKESAVTAQGMPSPDTVCLDRSGMVANEPLLLDQNIFAFDSDVFPEKDNLPHDDDMFRFLEVFSGSEDGDGTLDASTDSAESSPEPSRADTPTEVSMSPVKRAARIKSFNSGSEFDEVQPKTKKIKASPKNPRSRQATSRFRGVSRCTKDGRWQARIRIAKEVVYLGRYQTEELAARRYDEAARLHHGPQAMLNFVTVEDIVLGRKSVFEKERASPAAI